MKIVVRYGIDRMEKEVPTGTTIGQLKANESVKAGLGLGDNVKALIAGQEVGDDVQVPSGAMVSFETQANSKASEVPDGVIEITVRYGMDKFTKAVDEDTTIGDIINSPSIKAALGFGDNVRATMHGVEVSDETPVPDGGFIALETRANEKAVN